MSDVALRAGVSKSTVSFVLANNPAQSISAAVRERVFAAAAELSFHRRANAVALARGRSGNLALIFASDLSAMANPFYSQVVEGVVATVLESEYNLLFSVANESYKSANDLPKVVRENNADGVLLVSRVAPALVEAIRSFGLPVIAVDPFPAVPNVHTIDADNYTGGRLAAEHLLALGHRRLSVLGAAIDRPSISERWRGFRDAVRAAKCPIDVERDLWTARDLAALHGRERGKEILSSRGRPTAVFCLNDDLAAGLLQAAHELGYRVPDELSVVGFDDSPHAAQVFPPLTTVSIDRGEMGRRGVEGLIRLIDGRSVSMHQKVPVHLVLRETTARLREPAVPRRN